MTMRAMVVNDGNRSGDLLEIVDAKTDEVINTLKRGDKVSLSSLGCCFPYNEKRPVYFRVTHAENDRWLGNLKVEVKSADD